jgi:hypothetical protein
MATKNFTLLTEASSQLFGSHPSDVISPLESAAEAFGWLEEIFNVIKQKADSGHGGCSIKRLAEAGACIALDIGSYVDLRHEQMRDRISAASEMTNTTNGGDHV